MRHVTKLIVCLLVGAGVPVASAQSDVDPDEGTLSSVRPRIPEPMVFDLVRPLGAERGELEVNSLFRVAAGELLWAPEVEYAFAKGYGVELELPFEGSRVASVKAALQGTLPGPAPRVFVHGWQGIWERESTSVQVDLLYLAGARWHPRWSVFSMTGVRQARQRTLHHRPIGNYSVFYHPGKETSVGIETNLGGAASRRRIMVMPQVHTRRSRFNVQGGVGVVRDAGHTHLQAAWRVSREF